MNRLLTATTVGTLGLTLAMTGCDGGDGAAEPGLPDEGVANQPPVAVDDAAETREREPGTSGWW
jgi:hypothetical protein